MYRCGTAGLGCLKPRHPKGIQSQQGVRTRVLLRPSAHRHLDPILTKRPWSPHLQIIPISIPFANNQNSTRLGCARRYRKGERDPRSENSTALQPPPPLYILPGAAWSHHDTTTKNEAPSQSSLGWRHWGHVGVTWSAISSHPRSDLASAERSAEAHWASARLMA